MIIISDISTAITGGYGSERHNADPYYRATLEHVDSTTEDIVHIIPYVPYRDRINAIVRPYIDEYNARVDQRYQEAQERYAAGERKKAPDRSRFTHRGYDYYEDEKHRTHYSRAAGQVQLVSLYRSLIIHLGTREDRASGVITTEVALEIFGRLLKIFQEKFPNFLLLSATVHLGEYGDASLEELGGFHLHIDYMPMYPRDNPRSGLAFGTGFDATMAYMGYTPEDSIVINHHRPLQFNTMRNALYRAVETILPDYGLRLTLGVTAITDPDKNSSVNLPMPAWQAYIRDTERLQKTKNSWLNVLLMDEVSPESVKVCLSSLAVVDKALEELQNATKTLGGKDYRVSVKTCSHLKGAVSAMRDAFVHVILQGQQASERAEQADELEQQLQTLQTSNDQILAEVEALRSAQFDLRIRAADAESRALRYKEAAERQETYMKAVRYADGSSVWDAYRRNYKGESLKEY